VLDTLIKALGDDNELLCWIAADCLGQMGSQARAAIPALRQARRRRFKIGLVRQGLDLALEQIDSRRRSQPERCDGEDCYSVAGGAA